MNLRLTTVCEYIVGDVLADIGCDHGKLSQYVLQKGIVKKVYATDISKLSLNKTAILKEKEHLDDLELIVGDGLEPIIGIGIDTIVMCGIGSLEICNIINDNIDVAKKAKRLVIQPMKNEYYVREFLLKNGFVIIDEDLVFEQNRFYNIIVAKNGSTREILDVDVYVGRKLIEKNHTLLPMWLEGKTKRMLLNIEKYHTNKTKESESKLEFMNKLLKAYLEAKNG